MRRDLGGGQESERYRSEAMIGMLWQAEVEQRIGQGCGDLYRGKNWALDGPFDLYL